MGFWQFGNPRSSIATFILTIGEIKEIDNKESNLYSQVVQLEQEPGSRGPFSYFSGFPTVSEWVYSMFHW